MTKRRKFRLGSGDTVHDVFLEEGGTTSSFHAPVALFDRWKRTKPRPVDPRQLESVRRRRDLVLKHLQQAPVLALSSEDLFGARRVGDPVIGAAIEVRFAEMIGAWRETAPEMLSAAAGAVLVMNPSHVLAAHTLTEIVLSERATEYQRSSAAGDLGEAFNAKRETEAMFHLREVMKSILRARAGITWGPFAYRWISHLMRLERTETLRRCRAELRQREERARIWLINELADVPGEAVTTMLLRHSKTETSLRVKLRLVRLLGRLMPQSHRVEILTNGLAAESPTWRWDAISGLARVRPRIAHELARASLQEEPDELLRGLLEQCIQATGR